MLWQAQEVKHFVTEPACNHMNVSLCYGPLVQQENRTLWQARDAKHLVTVPACNHMNVPLCYRPFVQQEDRALWQAQNVDHSVTVPACCYTNVSLNCTRLLQQEDRTLWQARDVYLTMSPFLMADKIKTPLLLVHGMEDNNTGTFPMQVLQAFFSGWYNTIQ